MPTGLKKLIGLFFLMLLFLNITGFRWILQTTSQLANQDAEKRIDSLNYNEEDLIEIRVPLDNPYQQRFTDFERHYGELEINGVTYTFVQMKIEWDKAIFHCLPHPEKTALKKLEKEVAQNNAAANNNPGAKNTNAKFLGDYELDAVVQPDNVTTCVHHHFLPAPGLSLRWISYTIPTPPPEC